MSTANLFINGEWKSALDGGTREILNPANNQPIAVVTDASARDAELAISAARQAFDEGPWPRMRAGERAGYLFKLADALDAKVEEFALLETRNNGKPLTFSITSFSISYRHTINLWTATTIGSKGDSSSVR